MQTKTITPLLKPKHFLGLDTQLNGQGLSFEVKIGAEERTEEILEIADGDQDAEEVLSEIQRLRPYTTVIVNPKTCPAGSLLKIMRDAQKSLIPEEKISISHGLPSGYDIEWSRERTTNGEDSEGQYLVLVAFDQEKPIGFAGLGINLCHWRDDKQIYIGNSFELVYVHPAYRGKGFGIDLSIACGQLCQDIFVATYRAAPTGYTITPGIDADFESQGGERITWQLASALDYRADMLRLFGKRRSITVDSTNVDAGY